MTAPVFAVVGRPNKGKSSIVATLARDDSVGIEARSGSTREARAFPMRVDGEVLYSLVDTPGIQRARAVLEWLQAHGTDAASRPATVRAGFEALRSGGTLVIVGLGAAGEELSIPINPLVQGDRRVVGALYGSSNTPVQLPEILRLYQAGRLPLDLLLDRTFRLDEANEAFDHLRTGAVGRSILVP